MCTFLTLSTPFFEEWLKYPEANCLKIKNCIKISVGQAVLELLIRTCKIMFWSITQEPLGLLKFQNHSWVSQTIVFASDGFIIVQNSVDNWDSAGA